MSHQIQLITNLGSIQMLYFTKIPYGVFDMTHLHNIICGAKFDFKIACIVY